MVTVKFKRRDNKKKSRSEKRESVVTIHEMSNYRKKQKPQQSKTLDGWP